MDSFHFPRAVAFGKALLRTRDLDPVYVALAPLTEGERLRTVLAYSCLYHLGAAGYLGGFQGDKFWDGLAAAALNERLAWPRGAERRHWRGKAAIDAARWLREHYEKPEQVIFRWYNGALSPTFAEISTEIRRAPSFGPWISFKVADMMERCLGLKVDFTDCNLGIYREPRAGAALLLTGDEEARITDSQLTEVTEALGAKLRKYLAPPDFKRKVNIQETETVLCKYKSHVNGHYPLGKDCREVYHALNPEWGALAVKMRKELEPLCNHS